MPKPPKISIVIPTLNRPEELGRCLESIEQQEYTNYEVILIEEEGPLARLRNDGARRARGDIIVFIDDDVSIPKGWLAGIYNVFRRHQDIKGVSGPAVISSEFRQNRDLFRFSFAKWIYDSFFCEGQYHLPGHIMRSGAWTTGACDATCNYEGEVMFLEACNMAFKKEVFEALGGFDEDYTGVGDWSEPDLCYRLRERGGRLWFTGEARLYHEPSKTGAFRKRKNDSGRRLENYLRFSRKWISPHWRHSLYKTFIRTYYAIKTIER